MKSRAGWADIAAVRHAQLFELPSSVILQPGPAALTEGAAAIMHIFDEWERRQIDGQFY